jgi:siroheme synthase-like protein
MGARRGEPLIEGAEKDSLMAFQLPVFLDVTGKRCIVVGGGRVAHRKVESLLECGAAVTAISPDFLPDLMALSPERVTIYQRVYCSDDLTGAFLAVAATNDRRVNAAVVAEAQARGVLVCTADGGTTGDFSFGAIVRREGIIVAVSTGGRSPTFGRLLRDEIAHVLSEETLELLSLAAEVRREQREAGEAIQASAWQAALASTTVRELIQRGEIVAARAELRRAVRVE